MVRFDETSGIHYSNTIESKCAVGYQFRTHRPWPPINGKIERPIWEGKHGSTLRPLGRVIRRDDSYEGRVFASICDGGLMVTKKLKFRRGLSTRRLAQVNLGVFTMAMFSGVCHLEVNTLTSPLPLRADTTTTAQSELSPIRTMNLKYLPLSGIVFLALSLAYILKMAAKNYWGSDASLMLPGPATTSRDYIPVVYGE